MSPAQAAGNGATPRSAGGAMIRGVVLIIVAVLLGVVVLRATDEPPALAEDDTAAGTGTGRAADSDDEAAADADDGAGAARVDDEETTTTTEGDDASASGSSTSTTRAPVASRPPSEVSVLVANGSGVAGLAAALTEQVRGIGYEAVEPSNIREAGAVAASTVYYAEGYEAEAAALAATLSPEPKVAAMPDPAPVDDLRGATVLLVVGADLDAG